MQDPVKFRKYAEECSRLAQTATGDNRATLLKISDAWISCAEDAERTQQRAASQPERTMEKPPDRACLSSDPDD